MLQDEHYDGGITEHTALTVKNATPNDMGSYKCILENGAGSSVSEDAVEVSVFCTYCSFLSQQSFCQIYTHIHIEERSERSMELIFKCYRTCFFCFINNHELLNHKHLLRSNHVSIFKNIIKKIH